MTPLWPHAAEDKMDKKRKKDILSNIFVQCNCHISKLPLPLGWMGREQHNWYNWWEMARGLEELGLRKETNVVKGTGARSTWDRCVDMWPATLPDNIINLTLVRIWPYHVVDPALVLWKEHGWDACLRWGVSICRSPSPNHLNKNVLSVMINITFNPYSSKLLFNY